ncbi:putative porin [Candidatus Cardinium hertigii]|uniref:Porin n=1 Tax=Candidatus Cardinium hertigii TaxID=247481 RepID=A0A3N2QBL9_9BACT|nr:putative porin [Candidatus Cardinium hertigii]ROT47218.1 hypothetical protein EDM02_03615 [Candidatus Cardinium hertigii]
MIDVSIWWRYSLVLLVLGMPFKSYGEKAKAEDIFDKETEARIGTGSTFFITPREVKHNYRPYHPIDRSITKIDRFTITEQYNYNLQNLGNNWTASQYIFYMLPKHIGATYGFTAYDFFFEHPQDLRYYCMPASKAYAHFSIVLANIGSFIFDGCYSYRLLDNWHIGIHAQSAMTENEWTDTKEEKIVSALPNGFPYVGLFTHFKALDECYHLFSSWSDREYTTKETGGIQSDNIFDFTNRDAHKRYLSSIALLDPKKMVGPHLGTKSSIGTTPGKAAISHKELRRIFYLYHHYECSEPVQLYHELHYNRRQNELAINTKDVLSFITEIDDATIDIPGISTVVMKSIGNEIGIKGDIEPLSLFYSTYYRLENINLNYAPTQNASPQEQKTKIEQEHYIGCNSRYNFSKNGSHKLSLDGAYLVSEAAKGYHKLNVAYQNNFFIFNYNTVKYKVPYLVQYGYSHYRKWNKHFVAPSAQEIATEMCYSFPYVRMHPLLSFKRIENHIYYRQVKKDRHIIQNDQANQYDHCISEPKQAKTPIYLLSYGMNLDFCLFSYYHFDHSVTFFKDISNSKPQIFKGHMPFYMYTVRYYYAHQPFKKKLDIETGINLHYKDLYYGNSYDIIAQQFYQQKQFPVQGRPIIDLFLNFRISHVKFFLKYSYINEDLEKPKAYFATPFYPGQKKAADIGVHWSFFD